MKPSDATRGAALAETALVLTATLAMVFGIIQIAVIGYLQLMVDGAAFIAAHEYALGNTKNLAYQTLAQRPFPAINKIFIDKNSPDTTDVPVNFNTNLTTQRHGGVSLVLGSHLQATAQATAPTGLLGVGVASLSGIGLHGSAIEPYDVVSNDVYDVNANGYNNAPTSTQWSNYLTDVQNAPANYISQHEMAVCAPPANQPFGANCNAGWVQVRALGTAEFLDHDNWNRTNLGVGSLAGGYTFGEMLCHQQKFAQAAAIFTPGAMPTNVVTNNPSDPVYGVLGQIYAWDFLTSLGGGYTIKETRFGLSPMFPGRYC